MLSYNKLYIGVGISWLRWTQKKKKLEAFLHYVVQENTESLNDIGIYFHCCFNNEETEKGRCSMLCLKSS